MKSKLLGFCEESAKWAIVLFGFYKLGELAFQYPHTAAIVLGAFVNVYYGWTISLIFNAKKLRHLEDFVGHRLLGWYARRVFLKIVNRLNQNELLEELPWVFCRGTTWLILQKAMLERFQEISSDSFFEESVVSLLRNISHPADREEYSDTRDLVLGYLAPYTEKKIINAKEEEDLRVISCAGRVVGEKLLKLFNERLAEINNSCVPDCPRGTCLDLWFLSETG